LLFGFSLKMAYIQKPGNGIETSSEKTYYYVGKDWDTAVDDTFTGTVDVGGEYMWSCNPADKTIYDTTSECDKLIADAGDDPDWDNAVTSS